MATKLNRAKQKVRSHQATIRHMRKGIALARIKAIKEAAACVPTNWCDPLLTGPKAVLRGSSHDNRAIESLLLGIQARIFALAAPSPSSRER